MTENDPNKHELNPGDHVWGSKLGAAASASSELGDRERSSNPSSNPKDGASDDLGAEVHAKENTDKPWPNRWTGNQSSPGGIKGAAAKAKLRVKKKVASIVILSVLGLGAAVPFAASSALPFSIVGNMNMNSPLHGLNQYFEDYTGFRFFSGNKKSVSTTGSKIKGLTDGEITKLKSNGVGFEGAKKDPLTHKTTFTAVKYQGEAIHAGSEFNRTMRTNVAFRKAMVFNRGSFWKSAKSIDAAKVHALFKLNSNPDLSGKTVDDRNKKLFNESVEGTESHAGTSGIEEEKDKKTGVDPNETAKAKADAESVAGELNKEVDVEKAAIQNGNFTTAMAEDSNMGNVGAKLSQNGVDVAGGATDSLGGKVWGYANALSPLAMVCTMYQAAETANILAQTVALFNTVRFAMTFVASINRTMAGDDNDGSTQYLMDMLQHKDPASGQSFDASSYAAILFNGQLSTEPSAVSSFGGQAMIALYMAMHGIHSVFGQVASGFTLGAVNGTSANGRRFLRDSCRLATNLGVQIAATGISFVAAIFTGGGSGVAEGSLKVGLDQGFKVITEKMVKVFGKDAIKNLVKKEGAKIGEDGVMKYMARNSWRAFTGIWSHMTPFDKVGLLVAGVSTFGMGYIVHTLSGGNIAGLMKNGFSAFDAIGTGRNQYDSVSSIASGGNMSTYAQTAAYQQTRQEYSNSYVADMKYDARDTPLDMKDPYSALGSAMFGMQKMIGVSASLSLPSTIAAVAMLPFKLPVLFTAHADSAPTPEQIGEQVSNPFYQNNEIATTTTGSPQVTFKKNYSFQNILDKLVDSPDPQISYDGNDPSSGDPILTVIDHPDSPDGTLSLSNYIDKCHNPSRTQPDPELATDDNLYDINTCVVGGSKYNEITYPLYDDAVRFMGQVNPEAPDSGSPASSADTSSTESSTGTVGSNNVAWPVPEKWWKSNKNDFLNSHVMISGTFTSPYIRGEASDISSPPVGTPVYSMLDGTVKETGLCAASQENGVMIESKVPGGTLDIAYGHGINIKVKKGDTVKAGQEIMTLNGIGCKVTGPHLHIDMALNSKHICPQDVFIAMGENKTPDWAALTSKANPGCGRV